MKSVFIGFFSMITQFLNAQQISFGKLIALANENYTVVQDYLENNAWDYRGRDSTNDSITDSSFKKYLPEKSYWAFDYDPVSDAASYWLTCYYKRYKKTINEITLQLPNQHEYLMMRLAVLKSGFIKFGTKNENKSAKTLYEKKKMAVELIDSVSESNRNVYSISIICAPLLIAIFKAQY